MHMSTRGRSSLRKKFPHIVHFNRYGCDTLSTLTCPIRTRCNFPGTLRTLSILVPFAKPDHDCFPVLHHNTTVRRRLTPPRCKHTERISHDIEVCSASFSLANASECESSDDVRACDLLFTPEAARETRYNHWGPCVRYLLPCAIHRETSSTVGANGNRGAPKATAG